MKEKKRVFKSFKYRECDAFAEYLSEEAKKGWHFKEWRMGLIFEKGVPAEVHYRVEVFPKGAEMDMKPEADAEEYAEYCEAAGWRFLDSQRKFCIFKRENAQALPIVTEEERFQNIEKSEWKLWLQESGCIWFLAVLYWLEFFKVTYTSWIFNDVMMFILLVFTLEAVHAVWKGVRILAWHRNTRKRVCSGEVPVYGQRRTVDLNWRTIFLLLIVIGYCLLSYRDGMNGNIFPFLIVLSVLLLTACVVIPLYRPSRYENWALQIGAGLLTPVLLVVLILMLPDSAEISVGDLPLMQSDYMEVEGEPSYVDFGETDGILGGHLYALIEYEAGETEEDEEPLTNAIRYEIYHTKYPAILNEIWKREIPAQEAEKTDAQVWGASAAYKRINAADHTANYWVIYEDTILVFCSDAEPDELQIQTICKKLDLN